MSDPAARRVPPPAPPAPAAVELPISGRYAPAEYFPEAADWSDAQVRRHLEEAAAYERRTGEPFPRPWRTAEDTRGWRVAARGRDWPTRPETDVHLAAVLTADDYVWVARRAAAAGLRPSAFVARLVAAARSQDADGAQAAGPAPLLPGRDRQKARPTAAAAGRTGEAAGGP